MEYLKKLRKERKLTQKQLGDLCGISESTINRIESGARQPSLDVLKKLSSVLGCSTEYLLNGSSGLVASWQPFQPGDDVTETYDENGNTAGEIKKAPTAEAEDAQLAMFFEDLRHREDIRKLFEIAHNSTPEEVQQAAKIMEALRKE